MLWLWLWLLLLLGLHPFSPLIVGPLWSTLSLWSLMLLMLLLWLLCLLLLLLCLLCHQHEWMQRSHLDVASQGHKRSCTWATM